MPDRRGQPRTKKLQHGRSFWRLINTVKGIVKSSLALISTIMLKEI
jgi:hypothetical protein